MFKKDKAIPNIIARGMFKMHCTERSKKEISIIKSGIIIKKSKILDFGCGPGNLTIEMAKETGEEGYVYALDIHPLAILKVEDLILKTGCKNITTILTDKLKTGLKNESIDTVFIFNAIKMVRNKEKLANEIQRVLKKKGKLIIRNKMTSSNDEKYFDNLFKKHPISLTKTDNKTYYFTKK